MSHIETECKSSPTNEKTEGKTFENALRLFELAIPMLQHDANDTVFNLCNSGSDIIIKFRNKKYVTVEEYKILSKLSWIIDNTLIKIISHL